MQTLLVTAYIAWRFKIRERKGLLRLALAHLAGAVLLAVGLPMFLASVAETFHLTLLQLFNCILIVASYCGVMSAISDIIVLPRVLKISLRTFDGAGLLVINYAGMLIMTAIALAMPKEY